MSLPKFNENVNNIQSLVDQPTLTPAQLKAVFDKAGIDIKTYLNEVLTEAVDTLVSNINSSLSTQAGEIQDNANNITSLQSSVQSLERDQVILWQDREGAYMHKYQTANLSQNVTSQKNGIVLVFSAYVPGEGAKNWGWTEYFIPKKMVALHPGLGHNIIMPDASYPYGVKGAKYLYVFNDCIKGNEMNDQNVNNLNNKGIVLRYVIGV